MARQGRHGSNDKRRQAASGPSQRQLRAGELIRHALVEVMREHEIRDDALTGVSITVAEVRMSPDLRHAICFVEPLGAGVTVNGGDVGPVIKALNKHSKFLRGLLGRHIDMKFTPDLRFVHDESFDAAQRIGRLFDDPRVQQDLEAGEDDEDADAEAPAYSPGKPAGGGVVAPPTSRRVAPPKGRE